MLGAMRTWFNIEHHFHGFPPERHHRVETREIEVVFDEVLRNFAEVFMAGERAEPRWVRRDPFESLDDGRCGVTSPAEACRLADRVWELACAVAFADASVRGFAATAAFAWVLGIRRRIYSVWPLIFVLSLFSFYFCSFFFLTACCLLCLLT